jgi:hypothetical protein
VGLLLLAGRLECLDVDAVGVESLADVLDHAALARRVHALEDEQQGSAALGEQPVLKPFQVVLVLAFPGGRLVLVPDAGVGIGGVAAEGIGRPRFGPEELANRSAGHDHA